MTATALPAHGQPAYRRLHLRARLRAYREVGLLHFRARLVYRTDLAVGLVTLLLQVFLLRVVWTAVYGEATSVQGTGTAGQISLSTQIAYATLAAIQFWVLHSWSRFSIDERIRTGKIAIDVARPIGLLPQAVFANVGATAAMVPFAVLAVPFALLVGGAAPPASVTGLLGYVAATVTAFVIATLLTTLVGLLAFWTLETTGFSLAYQVIAQFLAGALVPLWFMPDWLRTAAELLPFQATTYTPVATYLGQIRGSEILAALVLQVFWIAALWLLLRLVWSRALRRVVVQGG